MKKLVSSTLLCTAIAASFSTVANNQVSEVFTSKYDAEFIEVHFSTPEKRTGDCLVSLRDANYPNTTWGQEMSRNLPGSPFSARQWATFNVPMEARQYAKQAHFVCPTSEGDVTYTQQILPAPPKMTFTLKSESDQNGGFDITGGVYVEGNASGTWCEAVEPRPLHGHKLFAQQLGSKGGYYSTHIQVSDYIPSLYHGYAQAQFECHSQGGSTVELVEFMINNNGELDVSQQTLYWH